MKSKNGRSRFLILLLISFVCLSAVSVCMADDHGGRGKHIGERHGDGNGGALGNLPGGGRDHGNETTGQIVAWSLVAANLTVALSLILKGVRKFAPLGPEAQSSLTRFNGVQKKYLMKLHYLLNPMIFLLAILHWTLSRCKSTALPEWGLFAMGAIVALGIVLKFKLCPKNSLKNVYKVHTQPALLLIVIAMLVFGHLSMD